MAKSSLANFSRRMTVRAREVGQGSVRVKQLLSGSIHSSVVRETPADTGRARSNWALSLGEPTFDDIEPYAPGRKLGKGESANADAAVAQAANTLKGLKETMPVYVSNNVGSDAADPYIGKLNEGFSPQSPPGFVYEAIAEGVARLRSFKIFRNG